MSESKRSLEKRMYCRYEQSINFEGAVGGLRIFIPAENGYVNYNFVHSVCEDRNCDMWRLSQAYAFDDSLENGYELTPNGAEWDMALRLSGRPDFIGGFAHGDERFTSISVEIDERCIKIDSLETLTPFENLFISVDSVGYDPNDSLTKALCHHKEYTVRADGITLYQKVEWLNGYTLGSSYMAMMPPRKSLTELFYTDVDRTPKEAASNYVGDSLVGMEGATEAVVYGAESGIAFWMSVPQYPSLVGGNRFFLTDNNGGLYNKMYFVICNGAVVSKGDVWETVTKYAITIKKAEK